MHVVLRETRRGCWIPRTEVTGSYEPVVTGSYRVVVAGGQTLPGPLEEQTALFTLEPSRILPKMCISERTIAAVLLTQLPSCLQVCPDSTFDVEFFLFVSLHLHEDWGSIVT